MRYPEPESSTLEWKRQFPQNDQILKTIIGFCNHMGGRLVLGVNDAGEVVGVSEKEIERGLETVEKSIFDSTTPPIIPQVYTQRFGEKSVLIVEVSAGMNKPYYRSSEGTAKGVYVRLGRSTVRAKPDMVEELRWQGRGIDYEQLPVYSASQDDLSLPQIQRFLAGRKNGGGDQVSEEALSAYQITTQEQRRTYPTVAGLLLFGRNPGQHLSEAMILCTHFRGTEGREIVASVDCEGSLPNQFEQAVTFVFDRLYRSAEIVGMKRREKLEIPEVAIREVLLNAIIHRNYHIKSPTKVAIYSDRVEVFSPGQFPGPINPSNLTQGLTYLRNPAICKVFRELGYVEKLGTGLITLFQSFKRAGLETPQVIEGENFVKCILPRSKARNSHRSPSEIEALFGAANEISVADVMSSLGVSRATASRRLADLVGKGKIVRVGKGRGVRYQRAEN